jgi:threonylcarbamoyladenosine tRNA methylthiotransferase MtaB
MTTFSVRFLGCKVSYADADALRERLLADGHQETAPGKAEIALVNTCCVTREAVGKSRQAVAKAARTHQRVYVTGCGANLEGAFAGMAENVVVVDRPGEQARELVASLVGPGVCAEVAREPKRVRAFVTIQDGCSFGCSYCVVPQVRGPARSRTVEAVLGEIQRRVRLGHKEVVLSGINLGCFRDGRPGSPVARLVRAAGEIPGLERLRLSSIEPNHLSADLIAALRETPVACKHLHVPLQSGDDRVLTAMKRRYDSAIFLKRLEPLEGFNLTTDVIVGFPAEDEAAFERTLEVIERAQITKVHVFPYSPRPATATENDDPVPAATKKERAARLRIQSENACLAFWRGKIGSEETVLIDRPGRGYGDDYSPWIVNAPLGELTSAHAESVTAEGIVASRSAAETPV